MTTNSNIPVAIGIRAMASLVGLSRQRFMQLVKAGVFPSPLYDVATRRPFFSGELQAQCLEVRKRGMGVNGKMVLFYAKRTTPPTPTTKPKKGQSKSTGSDNYADLLEDLKELGQKATLVQVADAVRELFPKGINGVDPSEVTTKVVDHLKSKNSAENLGRKE